MISVVIPCFDEEDRLDVASLELAIEQHSEWQFVFVDDGSTDGTAQVLDGLKRRNPTQVDVIRLSRNLGKGEAVRHGMISACDRGSEIVAYIDADLSTPFGELDRLVERLIEDPRVNVVLGSRFRHLGADIRRSELRHFAGRIFATLASISLGIGIYDTQCGAKAFRTTPKLVGSLVRPFSERWAFDVEFLSRLTRGPHPEDWSMIVEEPLHRWYAVPGSKLRFGQALWAALELLRIGFRHRRSG